VEFVSSAFLRICLVVFKKVGAGRFSIVHVSPWVKKVFKIAGFDHSMDIQ
jgi:anti-anti-sigma regulatory factor